MFLPIPLSEAHFSFYCNLFDRATKMFNTFTCNGAKKQRVRQWVVNEILIVKSTLG